MGLVKVILREDIPRLGDAGDLVGVKPGYARNYLIPKGIAIPATAEKVKEVEHHRRLIAERQVELLKASLNDASVLTSYDVQSLTRGSSATMKLVDLQGDEVLYSTVEVHKSDASSVVRWRGDEVMTASIREVFLSLKKMMNISCRKSNTCRAVTLDINRVVNIFKSG